MMAASDNHVSFDQFVDVLASVELVALLAPLVRERPLHWKWIIVGAHSALQGAMVCALFDRTSVLENARPDNKKAAQQAAALDVPQEWIENRLADFQVLLKRCIAGNTFCEPLVLTPKQREDIGKLHREFRNNFLRFAPHQSWAIEKAGLPRMIGAALDAAEVLMGRYYVVGNMDEDQQRRLTEALTTVRTYLGQWKS